MATETPAPFVKSRQVVAHGRKFKDLTECAAHFGVNYNTLHSRIRKGIPIEQALDKSYRKPAAEEAYDPRDEEPEPMGLTDLQLPEKWLWLTWDKDGFYLWTGEPVMSSKGVYRSLEESCAPAGDVFDLDHLIPENREPCCWPLAR